MKKDIKEAIENTGHLLDLWLPLKIKYNKTPGMSVGIVHDGKLAYANGFGVVDVVTKEKVDQQTLYQLASISKTFTSIAILQLVERELLRLDDKVVIYVPWFNVKSKNSNAANVTIRQLLSHTSGIFRDGDTSHWETGEFPSDLQSSFCSRSLILENALNYKYSNYGFAVLGLVIEAVSGMSYAGYIRTHILDPLEMGSTHTDYTEHLLGLATGYGREIPDEERKVFEHQKTNAYAPAAGFISNTEDLAKFLTALALDYKSKNLVLDRESKKELMRSHEKTEEGDEYGLGIDLHRIMDRKIVGHSGGFNGFFTQVGVDNQGLGVILLSNGFGSQTFPLMRGIFEAMYTYIDRKRDFSGKKIKLEPYEGIYRNVWGDEVMARFGNSLIGFAPQTTAPLRSKMTLLPTKVPHQFTMKMSGVFDSYNEKATFTDLRDEKFHTVLYGANPARRITIL